MVGNKENYIRKLDRLKRRFLYFEKLGFYNKMPDENYLKKFSCMVAYDLNIEEPKTYNEKLQWLKLYDRNPLYTKMVDKYEVKNMWQIL